MRSIRNTSVLAVAVSMAISAQVHAQRTTTTQIEEVVVTAQKREENMQDVAISMSAMDANTIQKSFSRTIDEITGMSPNLVINPILGNGTVGVSIRGYLAELGPHTLEPVALEAVNDNPFFCPDPGKLEALDRARRIASRAACPFQITELRTARSSFRSR